MRLMQEAPGPRTSQNVRMSAVFAPNPDCRSAFAPIHWVLLHPGTNGYVTSWGEQLAGVEPQRSGA